MENNVDNEYIEEVLNDLISYFGVYESINHNNIVYLLRNNKTEEAIIKIAECFNLPIKVNINYVSDTYNPNAEPSFNSSGVVIKNKNNNQSNGIVAQVSIPPHLPYWGTKDMINFPIEIKMSKKSLGHPFTLISIMAHELSHVVLYSMRHSKKENEFYTDLTAMIFGFSEVMNLGRKIIETNSRINYYANVKETQTTTTTYGYLSDENFNYAHEKINQVIRRKKSYKNRISASLKKVSMIIKEIDENNTYFDYCLKYITQKPPSSLKTSDSNEIFSFYQLDYLENRNTDMSKLKKSVSLISEKLNHIHRYTQKNNERLEEYDKQASKLISSTKEEKNISSKKLSVVKRYTPFFYKLKYKYNLFLKNFS